MVDAERLLSLLGRVTSRLAVLDGYAGANRDELLADRVRLGDLEYTFQTAIEACIDAAHHVVADRGLGVPATNADAFRLLAAAGTSWSTAMPRSTRRGCSTTSAIAPTCGPGPGQRVDH